MLWAEQSTLHRVVLLLQELQILLNHKILAILQAHAVDRVAVVDVVLVVYHGILEHRRLRHLLFNVLLNPKLLKQLSTKALVIFNPLEV